MGWNPTSSTHLGPFLLHLSPPFSFSPGNTSLFRSQPNVTSSEKSPCMATETKHHRLVGANNRYLSSHSSGNWNSKVKVSAGLVPPEWGEGLFRTPSLACRGNYYQQWPFVSPKFLFYSVLLGVRDFNIRILSRDNLAHNSLAPNIISCQILLLYLSSQHICVTVQSLGEGVGVMSVSS
jgi:hypothetical protein